MPTISGEFSRVKELNVKNNEWVAPQRFQADKVKARSKKTQRDTKPAVITKKNMVIATVAIAATAMNRRGKRFIFYFFTVKTNNKCGSRIGSSNTFIFIHWNRKTKLVSFVAVLHWKIATSFKSWALLCGSSTKHTSHTFRGGLTHTMPLNQKCSLCSMYE